MPLHLFAAFFSTFLGVLTALIPLTADEDPVISLQLPGPAFSRVEYFLLERLPVELSGGSTLADPRAVIALRRVEHDGARTLERDVLFRAGGVRVLLDERNGNGLPRLVWRELRTSAEVGRTWMAERDTTQGHVRTQRWGSRAPVHGRLPLEEGLLGPLELLERLREGQTWSTPVTILDPLGSGLSRLSVRTIRADLRAGWEIGRVARGMAVAMLSPWISIQLGSLERHGAALTRAMFGEGQRRTVELRREDQSFAGRYVFEGTELIAFQWQPGRRWARRIDEREYRGHVAKWSVRFDPLGDLRRAVRAGFVR